MNLATLQDEFLISRAAFLMTYQVGQASCSCSGIEAKPLSSTGIESEESSELDDISFRFD